MELRPTSQLVRPAPWLASCEHYLTRLSIAPERLRRVFTRVAASGADNPRDAMAMLHYDLADQTVEQDSPAYASIQQRVEYTQGNETGPTFLRDVQGHPRLVTTPAMNRTSMAPAKWWPPKLTLWPFNALLNRFLGLVKWEKTTAVDPPDRRSRWHRVANVRRLSLLTLVVAQTLLATGFMIAVLPYHGREPLEVAILLLFAILCGWISSGFWTAIVGFFLLLKGHDRYAISAGEVDDAPISDNARTALIMPICNEDVASVFAGLRATYESLARTGELQHFDFFILSDSNDPDICTAELKAWTDLCRDLDGGFKRVFYRWRKCRVNRKSGNVADFCRRWGKNYRYMVVMDADSVMSGDCLAKLVRMMEANPGAGIIQTAPYASGRETLYGRVQQFANRVYGPLFTAGMHFWQLGESHYWGHNAILRVAPFMEHCALGKLPGDGNLSGEILSHDFVEAALMRRAGWSVWLAYDLPGSYEEMPPNLVDELKRDRRWCHGNLINSRLFLAEGLHAAHRAVFATGVMAYMSAPLWFLFLLLSTALLAEHTLIPPTYFTHSNQLVPLWPEWHIEWAFGLWAATSTILFLPKILATLLTMKRDADHFGGRWHLFVSMACEVFFSAMLAPIRMLFHTQFIVDALMGWAIQWKSPPRDDAETTWREAIQRHGWHTLIGVVWTGIAVFLNPSFLWWLLPVVGALMLSIPISVYSSRRTFGRRSRAAGLFLIPEEYSTPQELRRKRDVIADATDKTDFTDAVVDPAINALICASGSARVNQTPAIRGARRQLVHRALREGPLALKDREKINLLNDPLALSQMHFDAWTSADVHPAWFVKTTPSAKDVVDSSILSPSPLTKSQLAGNVAN